MCTSSNPAVRHIAPKEYACWSVHPWLARPVAPGCTCRSTAKNRPPGASTRRTSARPAATSSQWCTVATDHAAVTECSGSGRFSALPCDHTILGPFRVTIRASRSIRGAGSTPVTRAPLRAAALTAAPGPQPISTAWSALDRPATSTTKRARLRAKASMPSAMRSPNGPAKRWPSAWWLTGRSDGESMVRSGQRRDQLLDRHPRPGEERRLLAGVAPRVGGPQFPHQVDDAMQFRCLERQQPFVVAERERRHGVGPDVLVLAGRHAVLGQHPAALLVGQQVPLVGPHERVDADVVARLLAGQERR